MAEQEHKLAHRAIPHQHPTQRLTARCDSSSIGPSHRQVLSEQHGQLQELLERETSKRRQKLQAKLDALQSQSGRLSQDPDISLSSSISVAAESLGSRAAGSAEIRALWQRQKSELVTLREELQTRLDQLYLRFQQEWMLDPQTKAPVNVALPISIESKYLAGSSLGRVLPAALAETCVKRPADPIEFLAMYLRKQAHNAQQQRQKAVTELQEQLEREQESLKRQHRRAIATETRLAQNEQQRRKDIFNSCVGDEPARGEDHEDEEERDSASARSDEVDPSTITCDQEPPESEAEHRPVASPRVSNINDSRQKTTEDGLEPEQLLSPRSGGVQERPGSTSSLYTIKEA